jgi:hypothetical protein
MAVTVAATMAAVLVGWSIRISSDSALNHYFIAQYIRLDASLLVQVLTTFRELLQQWWGTFPRLWPGLVATVAVIGILAWIIVDPVVGPTALLTVLLPFGASVVNRWPMALRTNLAMLVLLHCGAWIAIGCTIETILLAFRLRFNRSLPLDVGALIGAMVVTAACALTVREVRHEPTEISEVGPLLDHVARLSTSADTVVLDGTSHVLNSVEPRPLAGRIVRGPWFYGESADVRRMLSFSVNSCGNVFVLVSHIHDAKRALFADRTLTTELRLQWQGKNVGLYRTTSPQNGTCTGLPALDLSNIRVPP